MFIFLDLNDKTVKKKFVICQQMLLKFSRKNFQEVEAVMVAGSRGKTQCKVYSRPGGGLCNINPNQVMATEHNQINEKNNQLNYKVLSLCSNSLEKHVFLVSFFFYELLFPSLICPI